MSAKPLVPPKPPAEPSPHRRDFHHRDDGPPSASNGASLPHFEPFCRFNPTVVTIANADDSSCAPSVVVTHDGEVPPQDTADVPVAGAGAAVSVVSSGGRRKRRPPSASPCGSMSFTPTAVLTPPSGRVPVFPQAEDLAREIDAQAARPSVKFSSASLLVSGDQVSSTSSGSQSTAAMTLVTLPNSSESSRSAEIGDESAAAAAAAAATSDSASSCSATVSVSASAQLVAERNPLDGGLSDQRDAALMRPIQNEPIAQHQHRHHSASRHHCDAALLPSLGCDATTENFRNPALALPSAKRLQQQLQQQPRGGGSGGHSHRSSRRTSTPRTETRLKNLYHRAVEQPAKPALRTRSNPPGGGFISVTSAPQSSCNSQTSIFSLDSAAAMSAEDLRAMMRVYNPHYSCVVDATIDMAASGGVETELDKHAACVEDSPE